VAVGAAREEDPQLAVIQKAILAVCGRLRTIAGVVQTGLEGNDASIQRVEGRIAALENVVGDFCGGAFNLTFTPGSRRAQEPQPPICSLPLPRLPTAAPSSSPVPAPAAIERLATEPPTYHLSRGITTIPDLWREWTVGLGGQLSVEALDERWGSRWRHGAESQFYSRRKVIIDEIKRLVAGGQGGDRRRRLPGGAAGEVQGLIEPGHQRPQGRGFTSPFPNTLGSVFLPSARVFTTGDMSEPLMWNLKTDTLRREGRMRVTL